jgi:hypothetical protein
MLIVVPDVKFVLFDRIFTKSGLDKKWWWPILRYCAGIFLEGLTDDSRIPSQRFEPVTPAIMSDASPFLYPFRWRREPDSLNDRENIWPIGDISVILVEELIHVRAFLQYLILRIYAGFGDKCDPSPGLKEQSHLHYLQ